MNTEAIKPVAFFLILTAVLFFGAHKIASTPDVKFEALNTSAATFVELVSALESIEFDLDFVESLVVRGNAGSSSVQVPPLSTAPGRQNPFAPANAQSSSFSSGFRQPSDFSFPEPSASQTLILR